MILPNFSQNLLQEEYNFNLDLEDGMITNKDLSIASQNFKDLLKNKDFNKAFYNFEKEHIELYEKLAYLVPLEFGRTGEKEEQKLKFIKLNKN